MYRTPFCLALILSGCHTTESATPAKLAGTALCDSLQAGMTVGDSAGVRIAHHKLNFDSVSQQATTVDKALFQIAGSGASHGTPFGLVGDAAELADERIAVTDLQTADLFLYDAEGKFLKRIGRKGEGPGDYRSPAGLSRSEDTLLVFDLFGPRVTKLNAKGAVFDTRLLEIPKGLSLDDVEGPLVNLKRMVAGRTTVVGALAHGGFLTVMELNSAGKREPGPVGTFELNPIRAKLMRYSADGKGSTELAEFVLRQNLYYWYENGFAGLRPPMAPSTSLVGASGAREDSYWLTSGVTYTLEQHAADGKLKQEVHLCRAPSPVTEKDRRHFTALQIQPLKPGDARDETEDQLNRAPAPAMRPAFISLVASPSGGIWAQEFSFADEPSVWWVFSPDGSTVRTVRLPANRRLLEVGTERLLALYTDMDGNQRVEVYQVPIR